MLDIHALLNGLAAERPVFHSEADFQFALAWRIRERTGQPVRLEWKPFARKGMYLDLWLPQTGVAVELKYVTRRFDADWRGESFSLRNHAAQPPRRYDFLKDLARLELVASELPPARGGIAVLVTNQPAFWKPPSRSDTVDAAFRLHEGRRLDAEMAWSAETGAKTKEGREAPIFLKGSYTLEWRDYATLSGNAGARFRYLAVAVSQEAVETLVD